MYLLCIAKVVYFSLLEWGDISVIGVVCHHILHISCCSIIIICKRIYGVEAAKRPIAYYKNFQEEASKSTHAIKMYT